MRRSLVQRIKQIGQRRTSNLSRFASPSLDVAHQDEPLLVNEVQDGVENLLEQVAEPRQL